MVTRRALSERILALLLTAILGGMVAILVPGPTPAAGQPKPGGKILFAARQDIDTLDPHITNRAATRKILIQFMETLTVVNPQDGKISPGLAESWDISRDGKTYTFKLRKNVKFHDGTPVDAAAVRFTFDRIQEPLGAAGVARAFLGPYEGSEAVDPHTVRVKFKQPYAPFLRMAGLSPLGPISPTAVKKMGHTNRLASFNPARLSDPEVDKLLDQASAMIEEGARMEGYRRIQRMLLEMGAGIPLVDQVTVVGVRKEVRDYGFNVVTFPVLYDVHLAK